MKNLQGGIKRLAGEIENGEFKGLIIDRSKSQQEIDTQIDQLDEGFQKAEGSEEIPGLESEWDQYIEGSGGVSPESEKLDHPIPKCRSVMGGERGTTQKEKKRNSKTLRS